MLTGRKILGTQSLGGFSEKMVRKGTIAMFLFLLLEVYPWGPVGATGQNTTCPLDFAVLKNFPSVAQQANQEQMRCVVLIEALEMVLANYLRNTSYFLIPPELVSTCLEDFHLQLLSQGADVNITAMCNKNLPSLIARGTDNCQGIQSQSDLRRIAKATTLSSVQTSCAGQLSDQNLNQNVACAGCIKQISSLTQDLQAYNSSGVTVGCQNYSSIYAAAFANSAGPEDPHTAACLFSIFPIRAGKKSLTGVYIAVGAIAIGIVTFCAALFFCLKHRRRKYAEQIAFVKRNTDLLEGSMRTSNGSFMFTIEDLKAATNNFSRETIIGTGAYGNVYRGVLKSGLEIAMKRFKNCSPAGDKDFVHEVEMISCVRHRNLVGLRGCCVASGGVVEGHQRIIVIDYLPNGSLHDNLFKAHKPPLDWPTRQKIAIGTARGLDYLHHGVQPQILHRDIKSSNILLDANFEACVADFGLARFTPEGATHVSTRAAGTFGYVAPEYSMYGQLTERSDVYSFGVVLLELISGRKALNNVGTFVLISDWAWGLVKAGRWEEVLDVKMGNRGSLQDMERFVMLALLCAHPMVACRPTITNALRILENDQRLPTIPDRPMPLTSERGDIETSVRATSALFSEGGFQSFTSSSEGSGSRLGGR